MGRLFEMNVGWVDITTAFYSHISRVWGGLALFDLAITAGNLNVTVSTTGVIPQVLPVSFMYRQGQVPADLWPYSCGYIEMGTVTSRMLSRAANAASRKFDLLYDEYSYYSLCR